MSSAGGRDGTACPCCAGRGTHPSDECCACDGSGRARSDPIVIRYAVEDIDRGWAVWRQVEGGPLAHVGAREYASRAMADQAVTAACQADRAAATRLGVTIRHERA